MPRNRAILRGHYRATGLFCEATQNIPVSARTLPGFSDFSLRTIFLIYLFLYLTYRLETYGAHTLYLNQHSRQSTSIYLYYFYCSIRLKESSREMREIARGDARTQRHS